MTEHDLQNSIRIRLSELGWLVFRCNVAKVKLSDGRWFDAGLPKGHSDIVCYKNGKTVFIEIKVNNNKLSEHQKKFIENMTKQGFSAGTAWNVEDALALCGEL